MAKLVDRLQGFIDREAAKASEPATQAVASEVKTAESDENGVAAVAELSSAVEVEMAPPQPQVQVEEVQQSNPPQPRPFQLPRTALESSAPPSIQTPSTKEPDPERPKPSSEPPSPERAHRSESPPPDPVRRAALAAETTSTTPLDTVTIPPADVTMKPEETPSATPLPPSLAHLADLHPPSTVLYISNLRRPLLLSSLHEHLGCTARFFEHPRPPFASPDTPGLWLSGVKDHAYAAYDSVDKALSAAERVHGKVFPEGTGQPLDVQFLDPAIVRGLIEREEAVWANGRQRLTLDITHSDDGWKFDLRPAGLGGPVRGRPGVGLAGRLTTGLGGPPPRATPYDRPPGRVPSGPAGPGPVAGGDRRSLASRMGGGPGPDSGTIAPWEKRERDRERGWGPREPTGPVGGMGPLRYTRTRPSLTYREGPRAGRR